MIDRQAITRKAEYRSWESSKQEVVSAPTLVSYHAPETAANWTATNPVLAVGEIGVESDTGKIKFGDGVTAWNSLAYAGGSSLPMQIDTPQDGDLFTFDGTSGKWINLDYVTLLSQHLDVSGGDSSTLDSEFDFTVDFGGSSQ